MVNMLHVLWKNYFSYSASLVLLWLQEARIYFVIFFKTRVENYAKVGKMSPLEKDILDKKDGVVC